MNELTRDTITAGVHIYNQIFGREYELLAFDQNDVILKSLKTGKEIVLHVSEELNPEPEENDE